MMIRTVDNSKGSSKRCSSGKGSGRIPTLKGRVFSISGSEKDLALLPLLVDKFVPALSIPTLKGRVDFDCLFSAMELGMSVDGVEDGI